MAAIPSSYVTIPNRKIDNLPIVVSIVGQVPQNSVQEETFFGVMRFNERHFAVTDRTEIILDGKRITGEEWVELDDDKITLIEHGVSSKYRKVRKLVYVTKSDL